MKWKLHRVLKTNSRAFIVTFQLQEPFFQDRLITKRWPHPKLKSNEYIEAEIYEYNIHCHINYKNHFFKIRLITKKWSHPKLESNEYTEDEIYEYNTYWPWHHNDQVSE